MVILRCSMPQYHTTFKQIFKERLVLHFVFKKLNEKKSSDDTIHFALAGNNLYLRFQLISKL